MNRIQKANKTSSEGSALILTMLIAGVVCIMGASLMVFADYQIGAAQRAREDNVAMAIAEAGANAAFAKITESFANKDNASLFPATSYNGGSYDATVTTVSSLKAQISCKGVSGVSTSTVIMDIQNFSSGASSANPNDPYGQTLFVNGSVTMNGSGNCYGNVRCNSTVSINGSFSWGTTANPVYVRCTTSFSANGSPSLVGMVYAPSVSAGAGVPRTIQAVPTLALPTLNFTTYYNTALANSQVMAGGSVSGSIGTIPGGVRWYTSAATFNGGVSYAGCIISTGDIQFKGGCTQTKVGNLPAVASRDGSVTLSGARTMQGLIYSKTSLTCNGSGTENGTIIVGGNLTLNGSYGLFTYNYSNPAGSSSTNAVVGVTAWQK